MWKTTLLYLGATLSIFFGACGGSQKAPAEPTAPAASAAPSAAESKGMNEDMSCPLSRPGVEVAIEDVDGGVSLSATGSEDQVASLRQWGANRAAMASGNATRPMGGGGMMQGEDMGRGMMQGRGMNGRGMHGNGMQGGPGGTMMPPVDAMAEDVPGGVKLTFKAKDVQDVTRLREQVSQHASMMREGRCPMMQGMDALPAGADSNSMDANKDDDHEAHHPVE